VVHQPVSRGLTVFADAWLSGWLAEISTDLRETVTHQRCFTTMRYTNPRLYFTLLGIVSVIEYWPYGHCHRIVVLSGFFRLTRMHSADYAVAMSVHLSICHMLLLCLNGYTYPHFLHHRVAPPH